MLLLLLEPLLLLFPLLLLLLEPLLLLFPLLLLLLEPLLLLFPLLLLLLRLPRCLAHPLLLLLLFLLLLLEGAKASRPGSPPREKGGRRILLHGAGIPRRLVSARRVADGDGVRLDPQSRRLGGSFLPLSLGHLVTRRRQRGRLGTRRGALSVGRRLRVGGACKTKNKGRLL